MTVYSLTTEDMTRDANLVKELLLTKLEKEGLLKKPAAEIAQEYVVTFSKPGWFGSLFDKITGKKEDEGRLIVDVFKRI